MDKDTIQQIAAEVVRLLPNYAWVLLLIQVVLTMVAAGAGAFFGEYLKTRGKNLATKADFESLQAQLRANTELVETIKAEVSQKDWAQREWTNMRRTNLVALLEKMHDCQAYLSRHLSQSMEGKAFTDDPGPLGELEAIATLVLPELKKEVSAFSDAYRHKIVHGAMLVVKLAEVEQAAAREQAYDKFAAREQVYDTFRAELMPIEYKLHQAAEALKVAARKLMLGIMNVDERPSTG